MNKTIAELINRRAGVLEKAEASIDAGQKEAYNEHMAEAKKLSDDIEARKAIEAELGRFADDDHEMVGRSEANDNERENRRIVSAQDKARSGNEYVNAFAHALRNGYTRETGVGVEKIKPLYNALTIAGDPKGGQDGGFLVPEDMDYQIKEVRRALDPLATLFDSKMVGTNSGWYIKDVAPTKGFTKLSGELDDIPADDQTEFAKVSYALDTYALYLPMSKQLLDDEVSGLMAYLSEWIGKKEVITENIILLALLAALAPATLTAGEELDELKEAWNVTLDPAIALNSSILTNQHAYNWLDTQKDEEGKYFLQPDPTKPTAKLLSGYAVKRVSNAVLQSKGTTTVKAPLYVGDFKQYGTLVRRNAIEIEGTGVGGDAWRKYGYELRIVERLGAYIFDNAAALAFDLTI